MILHSSAVFLCFKGGSMWLSLCHPRCLKPANDPNVSFPLLIISWHTAVIALPRLLGLSAGLDAPAGMLFYYWRKSFEELRIPIVAWLSHDFIGLTLTCTYFLWRSTNGNPSCLCVFGVLALNVALVFCPLSVSCRSDQRVLTGGQTGSLTSPEKQQESQ